MDQAEKGQREKRNRLRYRCKTTENVSRLDRDFLENGSEKSEKRKHGQKGLSNNTSAIQVGYKYNTRWRGNKSARVPECHAKK